MVRSEASPSKWFEAFASNRQPSWLLSFQVVRLNPNWERTECLSIRTGCSCTGSDQRSPGLSGRGFRSTTTSHTRALTVSTTLSSPSTQCLKSSRLRVSGKERPKTVPATNVHHPGRRNLHERLGTETGSGETAGDCQRGT